MPRGPKLVRMASATAATTHTHRQTNIMLAQYTLRIFTLTQIWIIDRKQFTYMLMINLLA